MENMVQPTVRRPLERNDLERLLDDEDSHLIATSIATERTPLTTHNHLTVGTVLHLRLELYEGPPECLRRGTLAPEQMECEAFGRFWPNPWKFDEFLNGPFDGGGEERHKPSIPRE